MTNWVVIFFSLLYLSVCIKKSVLRGNVLLNAIFDPALTDQDQGNIAPLNHIFFTQDVLQWFF